MTSLAGNIEPTALDYDRAADVTTVLYGDGVLNYDQQDLALEVIARALAAAVTAEREKVRTAVLELRPQEWWGQYFAAGYRAGQVDAARRIREVTG